jgi:16S rRNA (guanine527-N7)-methyltransferase
VSTAPLDLRGGTMQLGLALDDAQLERLARLGAELARWNKTYNLTSVDDPRRILTHHLLDSLTALPLLEGARVADVGTGGGFPGLPLAIAAPGRHFTLIDTVEKKLRFVAHAARTLGLTNVTTLHARVENSAPAKPYDTVVTRAFAPLPRLCGWVQPLCDAHTRVIAMKGRWPPAQGSEEAGALPAGWHIEDVRAVTVPGLDAGRHLLSLRWRSPA